MQTQTLPSGLRTARMVAWVQGALGIFNGMLFILGGAAFATALGLSGGSGTAAVVAGGFVLVVASGLVVWAATLLGRRSRRGRAGVLAFEYLSVVLGVLTVTDVWQSGLRIVLAAVVVYYLQFDGDTRAAFGIGRGSRPAGLRP